MKLPEYEVQFNTETDVWLKSNLGIVQDFQEPLYHLTKSVSAESIVNSQIFRASFIRSTSDPLEYVLPLSEIRDWVCFSHQLWSNFEKPQDLFDHFNELATNPLPAIRPYFISMVKKPNIHLRERFGNSIVEIKKERENPFNQSSFLVPITYCDNVQGSVWNLLRNWRNTVLLKIKEIYPEVPERDFVKTTFYLWMKLFSMLGSSVKKNVYKSEQEVRLVFFSGTPDKDSTWFNKRIIVPSDMELGKPRSEYLPIKLNELGLKANLV